MKIKLIFINEDVFKGLSTEYFSTKFLLTLMLIIIRVLQIKPFTFVFLSAGNFLKAFDILCTILNHHRQPSIIAPIDFCIRI